MPRNSNSFLNKQKLLIAGAIVFLVAVGAVFLKSDATRQFSNLAEFPVENYLENNGVISQEDFLIDGR